MYAVSEATGQTVLPMWGSLHEGSPILSHTNPFHSATPNFLKIYFHVTNQLMPRSQKVTYFFSFFLSNVTHISYISHACYMFWLSSLPWFDNSNNIWWIQLELHNTVKNTASQCDGIIVYLCFVPVSTFKM